MGIGRRVDQVVGGLSRLLHGVRGAQHNTVDELEKRYLDLGADALFPAPPHLPDVRRHRSLLWHALRTMTLSWPSTHEVLSPGYRRRHEGDYARNLQVKARWLRPRRTRQDAALVYVHGWLEPGSWAEEAVLFPRWTRTLGVDLLHVALPFHGPRNPPGALFSGEYFWSGDLVRSVEAVRQAVHDVRSAVAWLRAEGYAQVGVTGLSLGGAVTMVLACLAPTPDYIVPLIAHLEIAHAVEHAPILWRMKQDLDRWGVDAARRRVLFDRLGLAKLRPVLAPERQLWVQAREDVYIDAGVAAKQWVRWGRPPILWLKGGHMTFGMELDAITARMASFRAALPPP